MSTSDYMVWIDCEMTGLNLSSDALIEVAVLVTDAGLNVLGDGVDVIIAPPPEAIAQMSAFVTQMHSSSGLLVATESGMNLADAEAVILDYVKSHIPEPGRVPLAGSSVGMDRAFLARDMPKLESHLHYRNIDVSSIKELVRRWYPRAFHSSPDKKHNHRALDDIKDSITELRYYRQAIFVPTPGPTRLAAKQIAADNAEFSPSSHPNAITD